MQSIKLLILMTILLGGVYPVTVYAISSVLFPYESSGQIIENNNSAVGSELLAQNFSKPGYFLSRPSAAGNGYDANNSGGSNLAPTNKALIDRIGATEKSLKERFGGNAIPSDLVTTSGSGLDPHISKASALYQSKTIAAERGVESAEVLVIVNALTEPKLFGVLGEERVNVLKLNLELDKKFGRLANK